MGLLCQYFLNDVARLGRDSVSGYDMSKVGAGTPHTTQVGSLGETIHLDGTYSFDVGANGPNVLQRRTESRSLTLWVYPESVSGYHRLITTAGGTNVKLWSIVNGILFLQDRFTGSKTAVSVDADRWNFVALTVDGTNVRQYVNGSLKVTTSSASYLANWTGLPMRYLGANGFEGNMADFRIYEGLLTDTNVSNLYKAGPVVPIVARIVPVDTFSRSTHVEIQGVAGASYDVSVDGGESTEVFSGEVVDLRDLDPDTDVNLNLYENVPPRKIREVFVRSSVYNAQAISLAEVQVFSRASGNVALEGTATQSSTSYGGSAARAIDGNTSSFWNDSTITHTSTASNNWWRLVLDRDYEDIYGITVFNRGDGTSENRLANKILEVVATDGEMIKSYRLTNAIKQSVWFST